jgi:hypothetical protein
MGTTAAATILVELMVVARPAVDLSKWREVNLATK